MEYPKKYNRTELKSGASGCSSVATQQTTAISNKRKLRVAASGHQSSSYGGVVNRGNNGNNNILTLPMLKANEAASQY